LADTNNGATDEWQTFKEWLPDARIAAVHIRNFRGIVDLKITDWDKRGTLFLIGPNGSGKSTVLNAIRWLFNQVGEEDKEPPEHFAVDKKHPAAIEVKGCVESQRHPEFFEWMSGTERGSGSQTEVGVLFKRPDENDDDGQYKCKIFALRRSESSGWTYQCLEWMQEGKKSEVHHVESKQEPSPHDLGIHVLSLSPTEASVRDAPQRVRNIILEYLKDLFEPKNGKITVSYKGVKGEGGVIENLDKQSEELREKFKRAVSNVSHDLGTQAYETKIELKKEDAKKAVDKYLREESIWEVLADNLMGEIGVVAKPVQTHTGRNQTKQKEKGHSAGTLQSLALLNLYGWLETMRRSPPSRGSLFILFLEEPEAFLHPQWARVFSDTLSGLSEKSRAKNSGLPVQAMVATHSPIFARVDRHRQLQIHRLENEFEHSYRVYAYSGKSDTTKPMSKRLNHIARFHPTVNELFFAKRVVLVEGPTEMWLFPTFARRLWDLVELKGKDPTHNTTLVPCGPTNMRELSKILFCLGFKPVVVHDVDPLKGKKIVTRNKKIESIIRYYGNPKVQLRRLNPDLEGVMGYREAAGSKPYNALLFLTWLFHGRWCKENPKQGCVEERFLTEPIGDWDSEPDVGTRNFRSCFSPLITRGTDYVPTVGSNFTYLMDVITEVYTAPGDHRTREMWSTCKRKFLNHLRRQGILTVSGQIIKPDKISVVEKLKE
jgi:predicted ATP-dependent endonuclease of OLD family